MGDDTLFDVVFTNKNIKNYRDYITADSNLYQHFNVSLRANGVFKPPGKFYISSVLSSDDFVLTENAIQAAANEICKSQ